MNIQIEDWDGKRLTITIRDDSSPNLMEIIKESGFDILATCGGMGLCATCQVLVVKGWDRLPHATDEELSTLDMLPDAEWNSRLACQIKTAIIPDDTVFKIKDSNY